MPTISVIVPVYKVELYIHRCIDSILGQTFPDFELILVDDGSPDTCGKICDEYAEKDSRIVVIHQENGGLSAARNAGIDWTFANSDSEWLTFVDSDDWVHPEYLERLYNAVKSTHSSISICNHIITTNDKLNSHIAPASPIILDTEEYYLKYTLTATYAWGKLYKKSCFQNIRYPTGKLYEDKFTTYRILFEYKNLCVIDIPLYAYFNNSNGITKSGITKFKFDSFEALENQIEFFHTSGYSKIERAQVREYVLKLKFKLEWFSKNPNANKEFHRLIKKKWRTALFKYVPKLKPTDEQDGWILTRLFPKTMWIYWHWKALLRKLKVTK